MPSKLQFYAQMADHTAEQITGSYQKWTAFLTTAARLYKYPYHEQLMIFAQRPEATACADYELWNNQMRRYVRQGSKGNVFLFPDGHAWQYSAEKITTAQGEVYTEVIFDDVTELYEKQQELKCQSRELKKMYRELKVLSDNVLEMTREQEILNLKTRLHDQMNMGVAAIRQILRQNTTSEENAAAVAQFRRAIQVLREENAYPQDDVSEFIRDAEVSGVRVEINGELPTEEKLLKALLAVMREACINAARHADATAMYVVSEQTEAAVTLRITNNGRQPEGDITPRGGLVYLEKQITRAGGRMEIQSQPEFLLTVTLPVGAEKRNRRCRYDKGSCG